MGRSLAAAARERVPHRIRVWVGRVRGQALERYARSRGFDLVRRGFYSPLPDPAEISEDLWRRRSPLEGIDFDVEAQIRFVRDELGPHIAEFDPAFDTGTRWGTFELRNGAYEEVDAHLLHGMIRHLRPRRVVELGSGHSSLVIAHAVAGEDCDYRVYDPYPAPWIDAGLPGVSISRSGSPRSAAATR